MTICDVYRTLHTHTPTNIAHNVRTIEIMKSDNYFINHFFYEKYVNQLTLKVYRIHAELQRQHLQMMMLTLFEVQMLCKIGHWPGATIICRVTIYFTTVCAQITQTHTQSLNLTHILRCAWLSFGVFIPSVCDQDDVIKRKHFRINGPLCEKPPILIHYDVIVMVCFASILQGRLMDIG